MEENKLYVVTILVKERTKAAPEVNQILTKFGHLFLGRMGLPINRKCLEGCTSIINLVALTSNEKLSELEKELNSVRDIELKIVDF